MVEPANAGETRVPRSHSGERRHISQRKAWSSAEGSVRAKQTFQSLSVVLDAMEMMGIQYSKPSSADEASVIAELGSYPEVRSLSSEENLR